MRWLFMQRHNLGVVANGKLGAETEVVTPADVYRAGRTGKSNVRRSDDKYHPAHVIEMVIIARR